MPTVPTIIIIKKNSPFSSFGIEGHHKAQFRYRHCSSVYFNYSWTVNSLKSNWDAGISIKYIFFLKIPTCTFEIIPLFLI